MSTYRTRRPIFSCLIVFLTTVLIMTPVYADSTGINFENPPYTVGTIHNQDGWSSPSTCAAYDYAVANNTYGYSTFGTQSFRLSNAVTSGCFDNAFSKPLVDEAGETNAYVATPSDTRQSYFTAQWDFASTIPGAEQPDLAVVASPDNGNGGRMSWVQMKDTLSGLEVNFYDYQDVAPFGSNATPANGIRPEDDFILTKVASGLDRTVPHTIRLDLFLVDGPRNDVVLVYVDGTLAHTGTSWEDYFRWNQGPGDSEQTAPVRESRVIRGILFRTSGSAAPATLGNGFLVDNFSTSSSTVTQCTTTCYVDASTGNDAFGGDTPTTAKKTIQAALNQVDVGGMVMVAAGTYNESVTVSKDGVTIQGADKATTIIQGDGTTCTTAGVALSGLRSNVTLADFTVTGFQDGIQMFTGPLTNIVVEDVASVNNCRHGVWSQAFGINRLRFTRVDASNNNLPPHTAQSGRGIWVINGVKANITVEDGKFNDNRLVGIDISDGNVTGLVITGNEVKGNGDSGIGVLGAQGPTANLISNNTVTNNGRFGIEIKNSTGNGSDSGAGSVVVSGNIVARNVAATDLRDYAGILVMRRSPVVGNNADQPSGAVVTGNTVSGYRRATVGSTGDGFGIVIEGINNTVKQNIVTDNDIAIQVQGGNVANTQSTDFFDRGDAADGSALVNRNSIVGNSIGLRTVGTATAPVLDGTCNWWGSNTGPTAAGNPSGSGDSATVNIDFDPWLGSNDLNGPCATPMVQFSAATATVAENGGTLALEVTLSEAAGQIIKVSYATSNGTATAGSDYTAQSGTLTFNPGVTSQTINVAISNNSLYEGDETFQVTLSNPVYATLGTLDEIEVTIQEDDAPPVVQFSAASVGVNENGGSALIVVSLNTPSALEVRVNYATADGTALAGSDYTASSGELIIPAGQTVSGFVVPVSNDAAVEPNETVNLQLAMPTNATLGLAAATLTIIDEDTGPLVNFSRATYSVDEADGTATITVSLSTAAPNAVTVAYATANGTALAGNDYTATSGTLSFAVGESSKTFSVPISNDEVNEAAETILLNLSAPLGATLGAPVNASLTIVNRYITPTVQFSTDEYFVNENSPVVTITVNLSQAANTTMTVAYATSALTATAGSDYVTATGVVTLTAGQITNTFQVAITDDNIDENDEAIGLTLTNASNATLGAPASATLTIVDNEGAPLVEFQSAAVLASEGAGGLTTVTVALSTVSTQTVTVAYATSNGSAIAGLDYTASNGLLTFDPGQTSRTFSVALLDDALDETDETVQLRLSGAVNASLGAQRNAVLAIVDNDLPPTVGFSTTTFTVNEGADPAVVSVLLSGPSGISITVPYTLNTSLVASRGATASPDDTLISGVLFFAPGQTQQTIALVVADDAIHTGNKFISLTLGTPQNATLGLRPLAVITVVDDEPEDVIGATVSTIYLPLISKSNQLSDN